VARVWVPTQFRSLCGGAVEIDVPGLTLDAVLHAVDERCPGFYDSVVEDGRVRAELAVAIDGEAAQYALFESVRPDAALTIIPAIGGG
jgi:hypothetical protein